MSRGSALKGFLRGNGQTLLLNGSDNHLIGNMSSVGISWAGKVNKTHIRPNFLFLCKLKQNHSGIFFVKWDKKQQQHLSKEERNDSKTHSIIWAILHNKSQVHQPANS